VAIIHLVVIDESDMMSSSPSEMSRAPFLDGTTPKRGFGVGEDSCRVAEEARKRICLDDGRGRAPRSKVIYRTGFSTRNALARYSSTSA